MHLLDRKARAMAATLAALAGYVDSVGFIGTGGYFLSFMSGNSTRLAVAIGETSAMWMMPMALILSFVAGVAAGQLLGAGRPSHGRRALFLVALLLAAGALASASGSASLAMGGLLLVAAAMGAENIVFAGQGDVRFGLTYMTGTLVKLGQRLADALTGRGDRMAWLPLLLHWVFLVSGAILGVLTWSQIGFQALWLAAAVAFVLALLSRPRLQG